MKKICLISILLIFVISVVIFISSCIPKSISLEYPAVQYLPNDNGYKENIKIRIKGKLYKRIFGNPLFSGDIVIDGYNFTNEYELIPITFNSKISNGMGTLTYTTVINGNPKLETLGMIWITDNFKSINIEVNNPNHVGATISAPAATLEDAKKVSQTFSFPKLVK